MGLDMETRKKICKEIYRRYQKARKKDKGQILNEYSKTLDYNRNYLAHLLANWGKTRYAVLDGKSVKYVAKEAVKGRKKPQGGKKTGRPERYNEAFFETLKGVWELFDCQCGKLLAPLIRGMIHFLVVEYNLSKEQQALLETVSPATIERKLKKEDVGSGWTEAHALLNNAHRWVKEQIIQTRENLPFPMLGIDSDNGSEFINHQLFDWCVQNK